MCECVLVHVCVRVFGDEKIKFQFTSITGSVGLEFGFESEFWFRYDAVDTVDFLSDLERAA